MENVNGIENFLKEFFPWYQQFLDEVKSLDIKDSQYNLSETKILSYPTLLILEGNYRFLNNEEKKINKGTSKDLTLKEDLLSQKLFDLKDRHEVKFNPNYKLIGGHPDFPQYDLFLHGLEFFCGSGYDNKVLAYIKGGMGAYDPYYTFRDYFLLCLDENVNIVGNRNEDLSENWRSCEHHKGKQVGEIIYEENGRDHDAYFYYKGKKTFKFYLRLHPSDECRSYHFNVDSYISISQSILGDGSLTTFLELLRGD